MGKFLDSCHTAGIDFMQILEKGLELPKGELVNRFTTKVDEVPFKSLLTFIYGYTQR